MHTIDLNCDLGESFGQYKLGNDEAILPYISSANIACGFHAGDPTTMRHTVRSALSHSVAIGAHPGLPDLQGFGRRDMNLSPDEVYDLIIYQVGALQAFVHAEGGLLKHVKPHGALYNMAAKNKIIAEAIAKAVYDLNPELILFGLANSFLISAAKEIDLPVANEVFADRTYDENGHLTARHLANALITNVEEAIIHVKQMITEQIVTATTGKIIPITADTLCIHGDSPSALAFAQQLHATLTAAKIQITPTRPK